jgi:hypothetical protein
MSWVSQTHFVKKRDCFSNDMVHRVPSSRESIFAKKIRKLYRLLVNENILDLLVFHISLKKFCKH